MMCGEGKLLLESAFLFQHSRWKVASRQRIRGSSEFAKGAELMDCGDLSDLPEPLRLNT